MKCERCGKELSDIDLYCQRCGKAVFPEYMDEDDIWAFYKSDEELIEILKEEGVEELPESLKKKNIPDATEPVLEEITEEVPEEEVQEQEKEPVSEETAEEVQEDALEESENLEESEEQEEQEEITEEPENLEEEHPEELEASKEELVEESLEESGKAVETEEAEILQEAPLEEVSQEETLQTEKEENRESEVLEEDDWDFDEEDDEEDEEDSAPVLTPQMKKARRWKRLGIAAFLAACLGLGIYFGLNRMKEMENQEKQYYENLKKSSQEPVQTPEEQPKEPAEDTSAETQTPAEEPQEETPKEEAPKEEAKKEYFKLVNPDEIDFSQYAKIQPASTEENSVKQSESYDYSAKSVVDGDVTTSWQENEEGTGEGKGFQLNLDGTHKIRYVVLHLGNWRSDQLWDYNARPKTLTIQVGDQQKKDVEFPNEKKKFCLSFEEPVEAAYVSAYIKEAYEGSRWNDNCISEIEIYE